MVPFEIDSWIYDHNVMNVEKYSYAASMVIQYFNRCVETPGITRRFTLKNVL